MSMPSWNGAANMGGALGDLGERELLGWTGGSMICTEGELGNSWISSTVSLYACREALFKRWDGRLGMVKLERFC